MSTRPPPSEAARLELEHHLSERIDALIAAGVPPDEARRRAEEALGDVERYRSELERMAREEEARMRTREWLATVVQDIRYAARALMRSPGLTVTVVLTLALGIGVNVSLFGIVDAVLLDPLPVEEPERLVRIYQSGDDGGVMGTSYPNYEDLRTGTESMAPMAAWGSTEVGIRAGERTDRVNAAAVSGGYFEALGVPARVGRVLGPADVQGRQGAAVTVLSDRLWGRLFGRDPGVVGRTVEVGGTTFQVVGVIPPRFAGLDLSDPVALWIPLPRIQDVVPESSIYAGDQIWDSRAFPWLSMVGRLAPGVSPERGAAELVATARAIAETHGEASNMATDAAEAPLVTRPAVTGAVSADRDTLVDLLAFLSAVVAATLVLACINVASLLLARATNRTREMAIRRSIGASRGRLIRQLLTESLVLAALGAGVGVAVAAATNRLLASFTLPGGVALEGLEISVGGRPFALAWLLAVACTVAFGVAPAWKGSGSGAEREGRSGSSRGGRGLRVLLAAQVAVSVVLVVGAALFARSVQRGLAVDTGLEAEGVAALSFGLSAHGYGGPEGGPFSRRLLDRLEEAPGVTAAAVASHVPLAPRRMAFRFVPDESSREERVSINVNVIDGDYFSMLGIHLEEGRLFGPGDARDTEKVAVLNRSAARALWPDRPALGQTFAVMRGLPPVRVVGVVEDAMAHSVSDTDVPYAYMPAAQQAGMGLTQEASALVRTRPGVDATALLRQEIRALEPALPLYGARNVGDQIRDVLAPQRFGAHLVGLLALVALVVSAVGMHGTVSYAVGARRHEIGIRVALGAVPGRILGKILGGEGVAVGAGLLIGMVGARYAAQAAESLLFGIQPVDPVSFGAAALLLLGVSTAALVRPVKTALAVDPRRVLTDEGPQR